MEPRLLPPFRLAMATLYSLPLPPGVSVSETPQEANDFLVDMQSRNVRRRILSLQQRHRDQSKKISGRRKPGEGDVEEAGGIQMGSSWLAFLAVLMQMQNTEAGSTLFVSSPPERLVAAQSVLHRVRRNKLVDAIDIEVEQDDIDERRALELYSNQTADFGAALADAYLQWLSHWNPFVGQVVASSSLNKQIVSPVGENNGLDILDEQLKGELMLSTLAAISYMTACQALGTPQRTQILEALGSAMAAIALRVRYLLPSAIAAATAAAASSPTNAAINPTNSNSDNSLVWMIAHAFQKVYEHRHLFPLDDPTALGNAMAATLGALPETILASPGGARGRLSVDPRALEAGVTELRGRGFQDLWNALQHISSANHAPHSMQQGFTILITLEKWARYLCVPMALASESSELLVTFLKSEEAIAVKFLVAVLEGGLWSAEQVLSVSLGLSKHQLIHQSGKRRQSSRSKKRHKELVSNKTSDSSVHNAQHEVIQRGQVACNVIIFTWPTLRSLLEKSLEEAATTDEVDGEGPIGCVTTAAHSCLPFLLSHDHSSLPHGSSDLFHELSNVLVHITASRCQDARCLAVPPLYALHKAILEKDTTGNEINFTLDVLLQCLRNLVSSCPYPDGYFADLQAESDEELEVYRNNVRDLVRSLTGGDDEESTDTHGIPLPCLQLLHKVISSLHEEILHSQDCPPETFVHALSALTKPLGRLSVQWLNSGGGDEASKLCMCQALEIFSLSLDRVAHLFHETPQQIQTLLPLARTLNIAVASSAPMMNSLALSDMTRNGVSTILPKVVKLSLLSLRFLPELATSENLNYEIRGTMRGPSGEDHVGSLSLMRLTIESDQLTGMMVHAMSPEMTEYCALHEYLKSIEVWGESSNPRTTPKSRRILLGVLCRLELSANGQAGASNMLAGLVHAAVNLVNSVDLARLDENAFFQLCETAYDLEALTPLLQPSFFESGENKACLETLRSAALQGYRIGSVSADSDGAILQWNRLRGGIFTLLLALANPDIGDTASMIVKDLIVAECEAVSAFISNGGVSNAIFNDEVISPDTIPAGLFLVSLGQQFEQSNQDTSLSCCMQALSQCSASVIDTILTSQPCSLDDAMNDPRCSIAEAWFISLTAVARSPASAQHPQFAELLTTSAVAVVALIFSQKVVKGQQAQNRGMSVDGPQTLALMDFLSVFLEMGPNALEKLVNEISQRFPLTINHADANSTGLAIFMAALFRAIQGAFPPWIVESIPLLFENLYTSLGKDYRIFGDAVRAATEMRVPAASPAIRSVEPGQLLSGYVFETVSDEAKASFWEEAIEYAKTDTKHSWKRLKHCIKAACGGKKNSDFRQKPALTRWEFDRL